MALQDFLNDFLVTTKDESDTSNMYYGFKHTITDAWYIQKITSTTVSYLFGYGDTNFTTYWASITTNTYYAPNKMYDNVIHS